MPVSASTGITSGIDYGALLKGLVDVKRQPINQLEKRKIAFEATSEAYDTLETRLGAIKTAASELELATDIISFTADSSDNSIATATSTSTASAGSFAIIVTQLAQAHKIAANGLAAETTVLGVTDGFFKFTVAGGTEQVVNITGGVTTLADLRTAINNLNAEATATIVNDGDPTVPFRLILTSDTTGASNGITITQNDYSATTLNFASTLQAAQDAIISVDTLQITRSSNSISDAITGVTLDLKQVDPAGVTITLKQDTAAITTKVKDLIKAYNGMVSFIKTNNRFDEVAKKAQPLYGDVGSRTMLSEIRSLMGSEVSALPSSLNRLIHVGFETKDGLMSLDTEIFNAALTSNFDGVVSLFIQDIQTGTKGFAALLVDKMDTLTDFASGQLTLRKKGLRENIDRLAKEIDTGQTELDKYQETLRLQFSALEVLLTGLRQQSTFLSRL